MLFSPSLLHENPDAGYVRTIRNRSIQDGLQAFWLASDRDFSAFNRSTLANANQFTFILISSLFNFMKADNYIAFLELYRVSSRKAKAQGRAEAQSLKALKTVMRLLDVHVLVKNGEWSSACYEMLTFGANLPPSSEGHALNVAQRVNCFEFAALTTLMLKFGRCYMPDYALYYLDKTTNFAVYYDQAELAENVEKEEYISHAYAKSRQISDKALFGKGGHGRKEQGIVDVGFDDDYYDETVESG